MPDQELKGVLRPEQKRQLRRLEELLSIADGDDFHVIGIAPSEKEMCVPEALGLSDPVTTYERRVGRYTEGVAVYLNVPEAAVEKKITEGYHRGFREWGERYDLPDVLYHLGKNKLWNSFSDKERAYVLCTIIGVIPVGYVVFLGGGSLLMVLRYKEESREEQPEE